MYRKANIKSGTIEKKEVTEGETIEMKVERIMHAKEPIKDGAPIIYTERKDGVSAGHNIRTDRWEVAVEAMDKVTRSTQAKREEKAKMDVVKDENQGEISGNNPSQQEAKQ